MDKKKKEMGHNLPVSIVWTYGMHALTHILLSLLGKCKSLLGRTHTCANLGNLRRLYRDIHTCIRKITIQMSREGLSQYYYFAIQYTCTLDKTTFINKKKEMDRESVKNVAYIDHKQSTIPVLRAGHPVSSAFTIIVIINFTSTVEPNPLRKLLNEDTSHFQNPNDNKMYKTTPEMRTPLL